MWGHAPQTDVKIKGMNGTLLKTAYRLIRTTRGRFFSLTAIVMIGVAFFVGVSASSLVMADSVQVYDDAMNLKDITIYSGYGFDEADIDSVRKMDGVIAAEGAQFTDAYGSDGQESVVTRIHSYRENAEINRFVLKEGRMPENDREALAEAGTDLIQGFALGSEISLSVPDGDLSDALHHTRFKVVGTIDTPVYLNETKENSTLSNQYIRTYLYVPESAFAYEDFYTELNVLLKDGKSYNEFSDSYFDYAARQKEKIEVLAETQADHRRDIIVKKAREEYDKGMQKYLDGRKEFEEKVADGEKELAVAEKKIIDGEKELRDGIQDLQAGRKELEEGKAQLEEGIVKLHDAMRLLEEGRIEGEKLLEEAREQIAEGWKTLQEGIKLFEEQKEIYLEQKEQLELALEMLNQPVIQPHDTIAQDIEILPEKVRELAVKFVALFDIDPETESIYDLTDAFRQKTADLAVMNEVIAEVRAQYAEDHPGEEIGTYGQLKELMGDKDPTFLKIEELLEDCEAADDTPLCEFEAAVDLTSCALAEGADIIEAIIRDAVLPDWITIRTAALFSEDILTLAEGLGLDESDTIGDLRTAVKEAVRMIDEGLAEGERQLREGLEELKDAERQLEDGERELAEKLAEGQAEIDDGWRQVEENRGKIIDGEAELKDAEGKIAEGRRELDKGRKELAEGRDELEEAKADGLKELSEAREDLDKADRDIRNLESGSWTVLDRSMHYASETYRETVNQMKAIAAIFPLFFLAVAALVCLTTMTRLLSEERTQIGVLQALGYSGTQCAMIYLLYAGMASLIGSIAGAALGLAVFPAVIYNTWRMMYILPGMVVRVPWLLVIASVLAFLVMMLGVTLYVISDDLKEMPSQLMRPKAPKLGRQTLLARIPFLWENLSFSSKVTVRNIVRYRQRMFMTVIGVAGCTALLLTGFGISDSINNMVGIQFNELVHYDGIAEIDSDHLSYAEIKEAERRTAELPGIENTVVAGVYSAKAMANGAEETVSAEVFMTKEDAAKIYTLRTRQGHQPLALDDDGVIINEKLAENMSLHVGDVLKLESRKGVVKECRVSAITEMYIRHRIMMTSAYYRKTFGTDMSENGIFIVAGENADLPEIRKQLGDMKEIVGMDFNDTILENFTNMVKNLDAVVLVLIFSSMALAFVVLGNLTNVNIAERQREIATIKVLGFRPREVENYIYKENNILVLFGAIAGIPLGMVLHRFIMGQVEMDYIMFGRSVNLLSIAEAVALTIVFGLLVNFFMRRRLLNIQMVESLKSVE